MLRLTSKTETLLEEAVNRIAPLVGADHVLIATSTLLADIVGAEGLVEARNVLAEPDRRNTLGCLVWAAAQLAARHEVGEAVSMAVLTADHKIDDPEGLRHTVAQALDIAEATGALVTIGIPPDRAETGYGYVELDREDPVGSGSRVKSFREKPDAEAAQEYLDRGTFLWNSGMFFWTLSAFFEQLRAADHELADVAAEITALIRAGDEAGAIKAFQRLPNRSIDYALMERAPHVAVVPAQFPWDDVGAWDAVARSMPTDEQGNVTEGDTVLVDVNNSVIYNENPDLVVSVVGAEDLIVIATKDAVMVCNKNDAQRVREIVAKLQDHHR